MAFVTVNVSTSADHVHPFNGHSDPSTADYLCLVNTIMSLSLKHQSDMMVFKPTQSNRETIGCGGNTISLQNASGISLSVSLQIQPGMKTKELH